jgi:hypothetical protein
VPSVLRTKRTLEAFGTSGSALFASRGPKLAPDIATGIPYWKSVAQDARDLRYSEGRLDHGISDRDKKYQPKKKLWHTNLYIQPWRPLLVEETDTLKVLMAL